MAELAGLSDGDLADRWLHAGLKIPPELVDETVRRGGRMVPFLGRMITDGELWFTPPKEPGIWAPVHALFLIQAIKDPSAAPFVEEFLREGTERNWILEVGDLLVYSLGPGVLERMWAVALDPDVGSESQAAVVDGLTLFGLAHEPLRADIISRFRARASSLLDRPGDAAEDVDDLVLDSLLCGLACLHDEESKGLIDRACSDEEIGYLISEKEEILSLFRKPCDETLRNRLGNPLDHFIPENLAELEEGLSSPGDEDFAEEGFGEEPLEEGEEAPPPIVNPAPKVGRNDPCPCGSGKKYKKCCLK
jgi:hypothetical protein